MQPRATLLRLFALLLALALVGAACGDDGDETATADDATGSAVAAGEPADTESEDAAADTESDAEAADAGQTDPDAGADSAFPVTIPHAFGETVIDAEPTRVVAWGWASADAAIAMDVIPVAIPFQGYGGDEEGVLPWIREAVDAAGVEMPIVLPDVPGGESPPFEAIAAADPDLILAVYSGITEEDYELLSEIAPTVAYPEAAWSTEWRDTIEIVGASLGRPEAAEEVLADIDTRIAEAAAAHPEFAGVTVAQVWDTGDIFYVYEPADARVAFTTDLGFEVAPSVTDLGTDESTFFFTLSHERLGELDSDLLIAYADTEEGMQTFLDSAPAQLMDQVTEGRVAAVIGTEFIASVSPPTALSLVWGLDEYVAILADAVAGASAAPAGDAAAGAGGGETEAAAAAWSVVFDSTTSFEDKAPHLEDADALASTIEAYTEAGSMMGGISLAPTDVTVEGDTATITYDVLFGENPAYGDQTGEMTLVDGVWTVSRDEFCGFMASARNPCT
ncbi:MAG: iron-siderophore ABC transporter substrate-binding protein [Acidimicrobiales bacterium]